ncbi:MAG: hydroxyproline-2-epimerase [Opitutae bacterium]|nr:hydroxyproline-2-epimerase [Opitutae bacterium]
MNRMKVQFIDSHTGGEPTRVIITGGPNLGTEGLAQRMEIFQKEQDGFRRAVINEPRGWEAMVGALLCEPHDKTCDAGVIFFNNVGYLGMCGHGTIGLAVTLYEMGRVGLGTLRLETPVGIVEAELHSANRVSIRNVPSYRYKKSVQVDVEGFGKVTGDIAWGGNWFFLVEDSPLPLDSKKIKELTEFTLHIRSALEGAGIYGENGGVIDHIELFGPSPLEGVQSRNFVLCPGGAYDRSPCGTGTSAKLACLAEDGKLKPGETWVQESIIGSVFEGSYERIDDSKVLPRITGSAHLSSRGDLLWQEGDPFCGGI